MLLNRTFDQTLLGKNYLSFIIGLTLLRKGQSVLLVDDHRIAMDDLWGHYLTCLDLKYLQLWGIVHNIEELKCLDRYLKQVPVTFYLGAKAWHLPGHPSGNLAECRRKFPEIFTLSDHLGHGNIDHVYGQCVESLAEVSFRSKTLQTMDTSFYRSMKWQAFDQLFATIYAQYKILLKTNPKHAFIQFLCLAKSLYHREVLFELDEFELGHLLLCLLGPLYQLDYRALGADLGQKFQHRGGGVKQSTINSWQVYQGRLAHIELDSFEGVITPHHSHFMGQLSGDFPFSNALDGDGYRGAWCKLSSPEGAFDFTCGRRICYSHLDSLGSDLPLIEFYGMSSQLLYAWVAYRNRPGAKYSFYQKEIKKFLGQALGHMAIHPLGEEVLARDKEMVESPVFWPRREVMGFAKNFRLQTKKLALQQNLGPLSRSKVEGLDYWGPLRCYSVGLFSYLVDAKDSLC